MTKPNILLFGAEWCAACKVIKPVLEELGNVIYTDIDMIESDELITRYRVRSVPTYVNLDNDRVGVGAKTKSEIVSVLGL